GRCPGAPRRAVAGGGPGAAQRLPARTRPRRRPVTRGGTMREDTMAHRVGRRMTARIRARGWLRTESPLHVGGLGSDPSDALPIAVDGLGRLYVPGTTLAGVLRHWMVGAAARPVRTGPPTPAPGS